VEDITYGCENNFSQWGDEQEVYIEQPQGFEEHGKKSHVCKLTCFLEIYPFVLGRHINDLFV